MIDKIISAYRDGSTLSVIAESFSLTEDEVLSSLEKYRLDNKKGRSYTEELKKVVAQRDANGLARRQIARELNININTIQKFCKEFGNAVKERASSENAYTKVANANIYLDDNNYKIKTCPSCKSRKVNEIHSMINNVNTIGVFCLNCGDEHFVFNSGVHRVNWEYLDD